MNHKDLLDAVVNNMTANNIPEAPSQDKIDNSIHLELSTGDTFLVDTDDFKWDEAIQKIDMMTENEKSFMNIIRSSILMSSNDDYTDWVETMKNNISAYMDGYGIHVNYRTTFPDITDKEILMLMTFDANNITRTMKYHVMEFMYNNHNIPEAPSQDSEILWKCIKSLDDTGNLEGISINKIDDFSPDEFSVVSIENDHSVSVIVSGNSPADALNNAEALFNEIMDSSSIITDELVDRDEYYDYNEEEFDPTEFGITQSEMDKMTNDFVSAINEFITGILSPEEIEYIRNSEINPNDEKLKELEKKLDDAGYSDKIKDLTQSMFNNGGDAE